MYIEENQSLAHLALPTGRPLYLPSHDVEVLLKTMGPSLGLWRAAEIAVLRDHSFKRPILDLGCGDGEITSYVLRNVEIGLDPWDKALQKAAERGIYNRLIQATIQEADLPDGTIATVLSNSALEHIENLHEVLAGVARVLKPGGEFVFTAPTEAFSRWLTLPTSSYAAWRNSQLIHLNLWSLARWETELNRVGLQIVTVRPYLRHSLVTLWDALELMQQVWLAKKRVFGLMWKHIPDSTMHNLAVRLSQIDLSASAPGGGRLIVARKI